MVLNGFESSDVAITHWFTISVKIFEPRVIDAVAEIARPTMENVPFASRLYLAKREKNDDSVKRYEFFLLLFSPCSIKKSRERFVRELYEFSSQLFIVLLIDASESFVPTIETFPAIIKKIERGKNDSLVSDPRIRRSVNVNTLKIFVMSMLLQIYLIALE